MLRIGDNKGDPVKCPYSERQNKFASPVLDAHAINLVFVSPTHFSEDLMTVKKSKEVSVEEILHPIELHYQRSIPEMVLDWTEELVTRLQEDYDRQYKNSSQPCKFSITTGRKYHKILDRKGSVHAFVNKQTGEVFKPASWNAPAKHVRYT